MLKTKIFDLDFSLETELVFKNKISMAESCYLATNLQIKKIAHTIVILKQ